MGYLPTCCKNELYDAKYFLKIRKKIIKIFSKFLKRFQICCGESIRNKEGISPACCKNDLYDAQYLLIQINIKKQFNHIFKVSNMLWRFN